MLKKYNRFTIIGEPFLPTNPKYHARFKKMVKVRCDCGTEKTILLSSVITGSTKSCGCWNKEVSIAKNKARAKQLSISDILIDFNNKLGLNKIAKKYKVDTRRIRKILLDNGFTVIQKGKHHASYTGYHDISGTYWGKLKKSAKERNLEFNLTIEYIWNLFEKQNKKCAFTNLEISIVDTSQLQNFSASLDRIDSSKGYIEGNVQWVHKKVNMMKQAVGDEEFVNWCTLIVKNRNPSLTTID